MKKIIILFSVFLCVNAVRAGETNSVVMSIGDPIGNHIKNLEAYPKIKEPRDKPFGSLPAETAKWEVGVGILHVTHTIGIGIITGMSYAIPSDGEKETIYKVTQFNPKTGELTIIVPNQELKATGKPAP
jgi:hypothetical protein